jgi:hypothetical protein
MTARLLAFALLLTAAPAEEPPRAIQVTEPPASARTPVQDRVTSSSGQFRINGGTPQDRAAVALLAEDANRELLHLTGEIELPIEKREKYKAPVNVRLHGKPGDPLPPRTYATRIHFSELGYEISLDFHLSRGIEQEHPTLKRAFTSVLVYERALRVLPAAVTDIPLLVPPWLIDGLREADAWRQNQSDRRLYEALFKTGGIYKIDDLFSLPESAHEHLDGAMRAAFRVSSGSLVMALLQQPQGRTAFRAFLGEAAAFQGEMPALLRKHFPELNLSETSLAKWWSLQLANIGGLSLSTDILPIPATEAALALALRLNFRDAEGILRQKEITAWPEAVALPETERTASVLLAQDALVRLSYRAFPSYKPLLAEYQTILVAIATGKTDDLPARLPALADRRRLMAEKAAHASDYLNWFEITRAREITGDFDDYRRLKERLRQTPHTRTDALSKYLDRLDAIFSRGLPEHPAPDAAPADLPGIPTDFPDLPPLPSP